MGATWGVVKHYEKQSGIITQAGWWAVIPSWVVGVAPGCFSLGLIRVLFIDWIKDYITHWFVDNCLKACCLAVTI